VALAQAVQIINVVALLGFVLVGMSRLITGPVRRFWFAGLALMSVNPIAVVLARKIWAQSVLPVFTVVTLAAHASRSTLAGAFIWGLAGALTSQVHMSGFFLQGALVLFTASSTRWKPQETASNTSVASAFRRTSRARAGPPGWPDRSSARFPLVPWALDLLRAGNGFSRDWIATLVPRALYTWLIDSLGVNTPYIYRPESLWFLGEPRIGGIATYGMAAAHAALIAIAIYCLARWLNRCAGRGSSRQLVRTTSGSGSGPPRSG
jgi:hypothetical protein